MKKLIDLYIRCFEYDVEVFSNGWLYVFIIPILFYLCFFFVKWITLTAPFWLPIAIIVSTLKSRPKSTKWRKKKKKSDKPELPDRTPYG